MRRVALAAVVLGGFVVLGVGLLPSAWAGDLDTPQWAETRKALFQERSIQDEADAVVQLDVPLRPAAA